MLNFSNKNVLWIFSHPKPQTIPSYLVSGIYPANYLGIQKVIFLENHDPKELLQKFKPKCLIISKVFKFILFIEASYKKQTIFESFKLFHAFLTIILSISLFDLNIPGVSINTICVFCLK